eukprot:gene11085-biopygen1414
MDAFEPTSSPTVAIGVLFGTLQSAYPVFWDPAFHCHLRSAAFFFFPLFLDPAFRYDLHALRSVPQSLRHMVHS